MRIRQSLLGSFDTCPRRFQYDLEAPQDVYHSGSVRAVGTAYHAALEYLYLCRLEDIPRATLDECVNMAMAAFGNEIEQAGDGFHWDEKIPNDGAALTTVEIMLRHYFEDGHAWPEDWTVLGIEHKFEHGFRDAHGCYCFDHMRTGTIDLVLQDPNGWIYGVDHKTAGRMWDQNKHKPRKNNQAPFYTAALQELYPDAPGHRFVFDIMTYAGKFERRISDPDDRHIKAVLDKAIQVATVYDGMRSAGLDLPTNPSSTLCSPVYCDHWSYCSSGEVLDTPISFRA